jgi:hypothetical protein
MIPIPWARTPDERREEALWRCWLARQPQNTGDRTLITRVVSFARSPFFLLATNREMNPDWEVIYEPSEAEIAAYCASRAPLFLTG